jgi:hypothetical protein
MEKTEFVLEMTRDFYLLCDLLRVSPTAVLQLYIENVSLERMGQEPPDAGADLATLLFFRDHVGDPAIQTNV